MKAPTHPDAIVSKHELPAIVGVSRQRIDVLMEREDFPAPICSIRDGAVPLWWRRGIEDYTRNRNAELKAADEARTAKQAEPAPA